MSPDNAAVYCRISSDPEGLKLGVTRQEEDCRALAQRLGWPVAEVYVDNDVSASKGKKRPSFERMLVDCEAETRDAILVYNTDRLTRRLVELATFLDWRERHNIALATTEGDDTTTANGRMVIEIKGVVAQQEARRISERVSRSHLQLAQTGKVSGGGSRPFGYELDRVTVRASEAIVIREVAQRLLDGESLTSICRSLDAAGITTDSGGKWDRSVLRNIMRRPRIAGLRVYRGSLMLDADGRPVRAVWPAILNVETWEAVRDLLNDPERRIVNGRLDRKYLLSGFLRCKCGAKMYGVTKAGKANYQCPIDRGCNKTHRRAEALDEYIIELVLRYLEREQVTQEPVEKGNEQAALDEQIEESERSLGNLIAEWDAGRMSDTMFFTAQAKKEASLNALKRQRTAQRKQTRIAPEDIRSVWELANLSQRRAILADVLVAIQVLPKPVNAPKRFDPAFYRPIWTGGDERSADGSQPIVAVP